MTETAPEVQTYLEQFDAHRGSLPGVELAWLDRLRRAGIERFAALGFPDRRVEPWRYTNLRPLTRQAFQPALNGQAVDGADLLAVDHGAAHRIVFVNGRHRPELSTPGALPEGVEIASLADVLRTEPGRLENHLGAAATDESEALVALNAAMMHDGCVIHIGRGVEVRDAIELLFIGAPGETPLVYYPRNLVIAEEGSAATIVEDHLGQTDRPYFVNGVSEIFVGRDARLRHYKMQDEGKAAVHLYATFARVAGGGYFESFALAVGARLARNDIRVLLDGSGIECRLNGAYLARGEQHVDNATFIDHAKPRSTSRETYKGVLDDKARGVFQGTIMVRPDAQKTDGRQTSRAILLSDQAEIDNKPALEIYADDVKCAHGATAGSLEDEAMFYVRSRGIPEAAARRLLIEAFLTEAIDEISEANVREAYQAKIAEWLALSGEEARS